MPDLKEKASGDSARRACVWDTRDQRRGEAFAFYHDAICQAFGQLRPGLDQSARGRFQARVSLDAVDDVWINRVNSSPHHVERTATDIRAMREEWLHLNLYTRGGCNIAQGDGAIALRAGEIGLFDGARPFSIDHGQTRPFELVSLMIPRRRLEARMGGGRRIEAHRLSRTPFARLARDTALALADGLGRLSTVETSTLFESLLAFVAMDMCEARQPVETMMSRGAAMFVGLGTQIERRFIDPRFDLARCAAEAGVSTRYVQKLFRTYGATTFGDALAERRLTWAADRLADPAHRDEPVTKIAFDAGFGDLTNFYRRFQRKYECSPGWWRRNSGC